MGKMLWIGREHKTLTNGDKTPDKSLVQVELGLQPPGQGWCHQSVSPGPVVSLLSLHSSLVSRTAPPSSVSADHLQCQENVNQREGCFLILFEIGNTIQDLVLSLNSHRMGGPYEQKIPNECSYCHFIFWFLC